MAALLQSQAQHRGLLGRAELPGATGSGADHLPLSLGLSLVLSLSG